MRNFLANGFGMIISAANLWRHRNFGVAEDLMLTVEYEDVEYVHECLLGSTVSKKVILNVLKVDWSTFMKNRTKGIEEKGEFQKLVAWK